MNIWQKVKSAYERKQHEKIFDELNANLEVAMQYNDNIDQEAILKSYELWQSLDNFHTF